jgi:hypothetical protein
MGRKRLHTSAADRQRAYRERQTVTRKLPRPPPAPPRRPPSRPTRLLVATQTVEDLRDEYQAWLDSIPATLQDSAQAERLAEIVEQLDSVLELLTEIQPPRGFGRD